MIWHIFQQTHSEMNLAWLVCLQTVPGILLLPFTGVVIDREDRVPVAGKQQLHRSVRPDGQMKVAAVDDSDRATMANMAMEQIEFFMTPSLARRRCRGERRRPMLA